MPGRCTSVPATPRPSPAVPPAPRRGSLGQRRPEAGADGVRGRARHFPQASATRGPAGRGRPGAAALPQPPPKGFAPEPVAATFARGSRQAALARAKRAARLAASAGHLRWPGSAPRRHASPPAAPGAAPLRSGAAPPGGARKPDGPGGERGARGAGRGRREGRVPSPPARPAWGRVALRRPLLPARPAGVGHVRSPPGR